MKDEKKIVCKITAIGSSVQVSVLILLERYDTIDCFVCNFILIPSNIKWLTILILFKYIQVN